MSPRRTPPPPFVILEEPGGEDLPVGAIIAWPHGVTYPTGWVLADGTANAAGSGLDLRGRFLVGWDGSHAANGGGTTHQHGAHSGVLAHDHGLLRYPTTTGASSGFTADTSMSGTPSAVTLRTQVDGSASSYTHDTPNHEPPYSPVDWIERMT